MQWKEQDTENITITYERECHGLQVNDLSGASKEFDTLPAMVDKDIRDDKVRAGGSHTRNLLRVLRGLNMVRILFQQILVTE